ncbi:trehalose-phosphatase [Polytolypa hystricis UAMH7299]|uniref:Trehalose-phosphatase n=1 Tax=Polytolypa hystricis (strain UAMH7299) TaxID=1447883 RepID=A0A2B7Z3X2_POLH7|nr:trehalose-phosphatase [Polytolypa hystricis UAMH7299]
MTIFIASLFLPYTVNFNLPENKLRRRSSSPRRRHNRHGSSELSKKTLSLFHQRRPSGPSSRPSLKDHSRIFAPPESQAGKSQGEHGFPFPSDISLHRLAPSDPHSPAWGTRGTFNQPTAQTPAPPSSSILKHGVTAEKAPPMLKKMQSHITRAEPVVEEAPSFTEASWDIVPSEQGNGGLRNAVLSAIDANHLTDMFWVGTLGMPTDALDEHTRNEIAEKLEVDHESLTVYVDDNDLDAHYLHFCKTILWPVFHYQIPDNPKSKAYEDHSWVYYVTVNQAFADRIIRNWKRGDVIWIHDYHLLLVPGMIRKALPDAQIGFFLHVAFPSSEVFRCLAVREELIYGILGANLIGFQANEYCHHFLQTCSRILSVEATNKGVQLEDRFVDVGTFPIGINPKFLDLRRRGPDVAEWIRIIKARYQGKYLIVARDKLDNIRGVRQKLLAYELFLNKYPQWRDKVVLIQVASSTTSEQSELDATVSDIATRVNSIHSSLAHQPLIFLKQDIMFSQYLALITVANVLMVTSLREGMNLTSHEFIHCQDGKYSDTKHGSLILSEFTGSASLFDGHPFLVNPWDYQQCAEALNTALELSPEQRERNWVKLNNAVNEHTTAIWFKSFTEALSKVWNEQACRDSIAIPRLSVSNLTAKYRESSRRLFILDYEGTLASWGSPTSIVLITPQRAIDTLNELVEDPKNIVYLMSSRMPEEMERLFRRVSGLGLIAENGCFVRENQAEGWVKLVNSDETKAWKDGVSDMMKYFCERTEGSWIEERHASLVFHYANCEDQVTAERHAAECANHINDTCEGSQIRAIPIDGAVIVEPFSPNKATAANVVFEGIQKRMNNGDVNLDFLLVIGDGREDEVVLRWANKLHENNTIKNVETVTLGSKNTEAMATLTQGVTGM